VLCSHGPVLPGILTELALATGTIRGSYVSSAAALEPAAFSVVHLSATNPGSGIIAIETHIPRSDPDSGGIPRMGAVSRPRESTAVHLPFTCAGESR